MNALPANLSPEPSDSEDVVSALETADVFWTKGDADEAIRWLKRASDSAMDAGNEMRGIAIMRSVADLKSAPARGAETPGPPPKMSRPPPPSAIKAPSPPSSLDSRRGPPPLPSASGGDGVGRSHASSAPQKGALPQPSAKTRDSVAPPARHHSTAPPPAPSASAAAPPKRSPATDRMAADTPETTRATATSAQSSRATTAAAEPAVPSARRSVPAASLPKEPQRPVTPATAYRAVSVFVKPQGRNGEKLEVILAKPGQAAPAGAEPALLVPMRRGGRLIS